MVDIAADRRRSAQALPQAVPCTGGPPGTGRNARTGDRSLTGAGRGAA